MCWHERWRVEGKGINTGRMARSNRLSFSRHQHQLQIIQASQRDYSPCLFFTIVCPFSSKKILYLLRRQALLLIHPKTNPILATPTSIIEHPKANLTLPATTYPNHPYPQVTAPTHPHNPSTKPPNPINSTPPSPEPLQACASTTNTPTNAGTGNGATSANTAKQSTGQAKHAAPNWSSKP